MKKILLFSAGFIFSLLLVVIGGYFWCNQFFFPKKLIPQIENQILNQSGQKFFIERIHLSPRGNIIIGNVKFFAKDNISVLAKVNSCILSPSYEIILKSWQKNNQHLEIPLKIILKDIVFEIPPIKISGQIESEFILNIDLKSPEKLIYQGNLQLSQFKAENIPVLGVIKNLNGIINIKNDLITSSDISGDINNAKANLNFKLENFKNPEINLSGELSPLTFNIECALKDDCLQINQLLASYNQIKASLAGAITDFQKNPHIQATANLEINLEDLAQLPLETQQLFSDIKPTGYVQTNLNIQGLLNNPQTLEAQLDLHSEKITISEYTLENIALNLNLKDSVLDVNDFSIELMQNIIKAKVNINLLDKNLPYSAQIYSNDFNLESIKDFIKNTPTISGVLNTQISVSGNAQDLSDVSIAGKSSVEMAVYDKFPLPPRIDLNLQGNLKNFKNILIRELIVNDAISKAKITGKISNVLDPQAQLEFTLMCPLEKLTQYPALSIPENLTLSGEPILNLTINGPLNNLKQLNIPFQLSAPKLRVNQLNFDNIELKGQFQDTGFKISTFVLKTLDGEITANASLDLIDPKMPTFELSSHLSDLNLATFKKQINFLPSVPVQGTLISEISLKGKGLNQKNIQAELNIKTNIENAKINELELNNVFLNIAAAYTNETLLIKNILLAYNDFKLSAQGALNSLFKNTAVELDTTAYLELADLNRLSLPGMNKLKNLDLSGKVNLNAKINGPIPSLTRSADSPNTFDWTQLKTEHIFSSEKLRINGVIIENLNINTNLSEQVLSSTLKAAAYGGSISSDIKADFTAESFNYRADTEIREINIGNLIKESKIIPQPHKGILFINSQIKGQGQDINTLNGQAKIELTQAQLSGLEILHSIGNLLGVDFLKNFEVNQSTGTLKINNATVFTEDLVCNGPDANLFIAGQIGFDQNIKLVTTLTLSESAANQTYGGILDKFFILKDDQYYTKINLKGTLTSPQANLDDFLKDKAKSKANELIKEKSQELLEKLFK
ncbi:MAG: AsmA-like C-terminal region-containing protein [Candidatus Omnitrophota bacterium]